MEYVKETPYEGIVCVGEGPTVMELIKAAPAGMPVVTIETDRAISMEGIANAYPRHFDATNGHLPLWLMVRIANKFAEWINANVRKSMGGEVRIPTGSGETLFELRIAYPEITETQFVALYDFNRDKRFDPNGPINQAVRAFFPIHFYKSRTNEE